MADRHIHPVRVRATRTEICEEGPPRTAQCFRALLGSESQSLCAGARVR